MVLESDTDSLSYMCVCHWAVYWSYNYVYSPEKRLSDSWVGYCEARCF